jgi:hypothetical protein
MTVHAGEVVRIERIERIRLTGTPEALDDSAGRPNISENPCDDQE